MPPKFNADRRDKKQKHRVTNWSEHNEGLRLRGDLTVWICDAALDLWTAPRRTTSSGQPHYSDLARTVSDAGQGLQATATPNSGFDALNRDVAGSEDCSA